MLTIAEHFYIKLILTCQLLSRAMITKNTYFELFLQKWFRLFWWILLNQQSWNFRNLDFNPTPSKPCWLGTSPWTSRDLSFLFHKVKVLNCNIISGNRSLSFCSFHKHLLNTMNAYSVHKMVPIFCNSVYIFAHWSNKFRWAESVARNRWLHLTSCYTVFLKPQSRGCNQFKTEIRLRKKLWFLSC